MIQINDFMIKTFEGLSVKNYKTFPSREWGDNGGMQADIYLHDKHVGQIYDAGDGGMANMTFADKSLVNDFKVACFKFLRRIDKEYRNNKYSAKRAKDVNDDDYAMTVDLMACFFTGKARVL